MEADPTEIGPESIALQTQLGLAYTREPPIIPAGTQAPDTELCRHILPSFQERGNHAYARHLATTARRGSTASAPQFQCLYLIQNPMPEQVRRHVRAGMALSDLYCDTYFRRISRRWNERLFLRDTTNDVGAAISAILGIANAGSGLTGAVGAAFGLADSRFRNYDQIFVVSPDLPALQRLVRQKREELRTSIEANLPQDFYGAQDRILEYAELCSYTGMRGLLNVAVDQSINTPGGPGAIRDAAVRAATQADRQRQLIAESRAEAREAELAALARERTAQRSIDTPPPAENATEPNEPPESSAA